MSRWKSRVDDLLYDGESVRETVDMGSSRVVVTSHRVLAFTPDADGENFRQADRPNVETVETGSSTDDRLLRYGARLGVVGGVLVGTGFFVDFGSIFGDVEFDTESAGRVGAGGLIGTAQTLIDILKQLDFLLLVFGLLSLLLMAVLVGVYLFRRDPTLVITVAGDEADIPLPRSGDATEVRRRLEAAIFPDAAGSPAGTRGHDDSTDDGRSGHDGSDGGATPESRWN
jgi:hypothetical protein